MNRYNAAQIIKTPEDPRRRYTNVKYPLISPSSLDIYVYTTQGDRYDILALSYYSDSTLWWVINIANPPQSTDSLYPTPGAQIRIPAPSRIPNILAEYSSINSLA